MKFITSRDSETGKKFAEIAIKRTVCRQAQKQLAKELEFEKWYEAYFVAFGGISSVVFPNKFPVDRRIWKDKKHSDEWTPRLTTKEGKLIKEKLKSLPIVSINELNQCIGFDGAPFKTIGFASSNPDYFGFETEEDWNVKIPSDCEEVITTKYNSLFGKA